MKMALALLALITLLSLSGCATQAAVLPEPEKTFADEVAGEQEGTASDNEPLGTEKGVEAARQPQETMAHEQAVAMVEVVVGDRVFEMRLYDNETSQAFTKLLPLRITMDDLHANEKYFYLEDALPTNASSVSEIQAGEVSLYGSDCLVLFYKTFAAPFSYSPIGVIDDPVVLAETIGEGSSVEVVFRAIV